MSQDRIRIGIVGAGTIVRQHHMPGLAQLENVEVVAVCNRHSMTARQFAEEHGIAKVCYDWHEIVGPWKVDPKTGGSALLMGGCHAVDIVRWMIGEQHNVVEVAAFSTQAAWRKDFKYDPTIAFLARFDNGAIGRVSTSLECNMPYVFHLQVNGTDGTLRNNGLFSRTMFPGSTDFTPVKAVYPDDGNVTHHPFPEEVSYFIDSIDRGVPGMLSIGAAARTYELVFAAELAARERRVVKLPLL